MLLHIDGSTSIEGLLRRAPGNRLQALGLLADLASDDQIELLLSSPQRNVSLRLPPMSAGAAARIDAAPKGGSPRESGQRKRVAEAESRDLPARRAEGSRSPSARPWSQPALPPPHELRAPVESRAMRAVSSPGHRHPRARPFRGHSPPLRRSPRSWRPCLGRLLGRSRLPRARPRCCSLALARRALHVPTSSRTATAGTRSRRASRRGDGSFPPSWLRRLALVGS